MSEDEKRSEPGNMLESLREAQAMLASFDHRRARVIAKLKKLIALLSKESFSEPIDVHEGRVKVAHQYVNIEEKEIEEILVNRQVCKEDIAKLKHRLNRAGYGHLIKD